MSSHFEIRLKGGKFVQGTKLAEGAFSVKYVTGKGNKSEYLFDSLGLLKFLLAHGIPPKDAERIAETRGEE